ncbi:MAG: hypothetical protein ACSLEN_01015 [Candidatus Malihini olakiniferum]
MKGSVGKHSKSVKNRVNYILKDDHAFIYSNMSANKNNTSDLTDELKVVVKFRPDIKKNQSFTLFYPYQKMKILQLKNRKR